MILHRLIVLSMLVVTTVCALLYISTFPVAGADSLDDSLKSESPAQPPDGEPGRPVRPVLDAEASRSLA